MEELLSRGIDQSGRKLRLKFGVDPTRPDIHLGHAVVLRKLRQFQDMGHTVIFLIGDYTTKIGDPSGKNTTRPVLTDSEIAANIKTYLDQVGHILNLKKAEVRYNSEWLKGLNFADVIELASQTSVAQLIEREDFANRLTSGQELALHELLYPLIQAYDSVMLKADVEFGGTDQLFNLMAGRSLQRKLGQKPQAVIIAELLVGLDGTKKMSKSHDNYVGISDAPLDMYGKIMSLPDGLIAPYYKLCTDVPLEAIDGLVMTIGEGANPRDSKASLAREIVAIYHGEGEAVEAEQAWNKQFREGGKPEEIEEYLVPHKNLSLVELLVEAGLATSKTEARRLLEQNGVRLDDETQGLESVPTLKNGQILQVGKRRYLKLRVK
jgi:tyrosyl-tRNA synthetase